jgi:DNA modification methylase
VATRFLTGDCRVMLAKLPADSVHCVVTSPPYWGLRDYGIPPTVWGGDAKCKHAWGGQTPIVVGRGDTDRETPGGRGGSFQGGPRHSTSGAFCRRCNAWRGAHGLEPTIDLYVRNAVEVFRAVHRVLRPDGVCWINLGDSYASGEVGRHDGGRTYRDTYERKPFGARQQSKQRTGLKPKDLCGIPWRVAFALQADGWWLRQDIIWAKPNPMPESVTDRCTKAHEYLFLLTKSARYFFDAEAIKEDSIRDGSGNGQRKPAGLRGIPGASKTNPTGGVAGSVPWEGTSRNKRSVWTVATSPFPEAHFATFPPKLIEPCIKAGTSERGCCGECGAPWKRKTDGATYYRGDDGSRTRKTNLVGNGHGGAGRGPKDNLGASIAKTLGWRPTCKCKAAAVVPCTVLDPFGGAGTTGLVCERLNRDAVLIELGPKYVAMARRRIAKDRKPKAKNAAIRLRTHQQRLAQWTTSSS